MGLGVVPRAFIVLGLLFGIGPRIVMAALVLVAAAPVFVLFTGMVGTSALTSAWIVLLAATSWRMGTGGAGALGRKEGTEDSAHTCDDAVRRSEQRRGHLHRDPKVEVSDVAPGFQRGSSVSNE